MRFHLLVPAFLACTFLLPGPCIAQPTSTEEAGEDFASVYERHLAASMDKDFASPLVSEPGGERKSGTLAVLYSVVLPGMGELYADCFDRGKYPLMTEAALWLGLLGVNAYGDWVQTDARSYARQHAGFDPDGKNDEFYVRIENYQDLYDYNNQRLIERRLDELYPDEAQWYWGWDSDENRKYYKDRRILSDQMHNAVSFFVLGMVANRIWSAIQSAMFVRRHNAALEQSSWLPDLRPQLIARAGRTDELRFNFSLKLSR
ncbi:MAG: hypothetical protein M5R41_03195 [Bacteroidia bacterium]|nr:hypothetical protein [Bacteroidia bacterium]